MPDVEGRSAVQTLEAWSQEIPTSGADRSSDALAFVDAVARDVDCRYACARIPIRAELHDGRILLRSVDRTDASRSTTTFSGDPFDHRGVLDNIVQHVATSAAARALGELTYRGERIHDSTADGEPHVIVPARLADLQVDPARALMLSRRRSREAHGGPVLADRDDPELDALDTHLASVVHGWPGATALGLWGERWYGRHRVGGLHYGIPRRDGDLYIASDAGDFDTSTRGRVRRTLSGPSYFHPVTRFDGDPFDRAQVLAAAARHVAWFAVHEALERATVDGEKLYDPHTQGEVQVVLPGLEPASIPAPAPWRRRDLRRLLLAAFRFHRRARRDHFQHD